MVRTKFLVAVLILYGITAVLAQLPCQPRAVRVLPGQRFCERICFSGPGTGGTRCGSTPIATTVSLCPGNCCRRGAFCQWVYRT